MVNAQTCQMGATLTADMIYGSGRWKNADILFKSNFF